MIKKITIEDGNEIIVDKENEQFARSRKWRLRKILCRGMERAFIEDVNRPRFYLHKLLFPTVGKTCSFLFRNNNFLDYRKNNILFIPYRMKYGNKCGPKKNEAKHLDEIGVLHCRSVIRNSFNKDDKCIECSKRYPVSRYSYCLDVVSKLDWVGWEYVSGKCDGGEEDSEFNWYLNENYRNSQERACKKFLRWCITGEFVE